MGDKGSLCRHTFEQPVACEKRLGKHGRVRHDKYLGGIINRAKKDIGILRITNTVLVFSLVIGYVLIEPYKG